MSYTVKIVDNKTGQVLCDKEDIVCIIGAFSGENNCQQLTACHATPFVISKTANAAENAVRAIDASDPRLKFSRQMMRMADTMKDFGSSDEEEKPGDTES